MNTLNNRQIVIQCINDWRIAYQLTGTEAYIGNCVKELTGQGKLVWFILAEDGTYEPHPDCKAMNYQPKETLHLLAELQNMTSLKRLNDFWDDAEKNITQSIYKDLLNKFSTALSLEDELQKKNRLIDVFFACSRCHDKLFKTEKDTFIALAKDCRAKNFHVNYECNRLSIDSQDTGVDYNKLSIKLKQIEKSFLLLTNIVISEDDRKNNKKLIESYETEAQKELRRRNNLKEWTIIVSLLIVSAVVAGYFIYDMSKNDYKPDGTFQKGVGLTAINIFLFILGMYAIKKK